MKIVKVLLLLVFMGIGMNVPYSYAQNCTRICNNYFAYAKRAGAAGTYGILVRKYRACTRCKSGKAGRVSKSSATRQQQLRKYRAWRAVEDRKLKKLRKKYRKQALGNKRLKGFTLKQQISCCLRYERKLCRTGRFENGKSLPPAGRTMACRSTRNSCRNLVVNMGGRYCGK